MSNVLFVVAHADDEVLGAGATIAKMKERGDTVSVLTLSLESPTREEEVWMRKAQASSHAVLGIDKTINADLETMRFAEYDKHRLCVLIEDAIKNTGCDKLYTHSPEDLHNDHKVTSQAVMEAMRIYHRWNEGNELKAVYFMEIPTSTDWAFEPLHVNSFVSVTTEQVNKKVAALCVYDGVIREVPHPRNEESFLSLARYRGGQCGCEYAEAFRKVYEIDE